LGAPESAALELIVNGKVQPLGRWPDADQNVAPYNHGYMSIASKSSATSFTISDRPHEPLGKQRPMPGYTAILGLLG
jgi:hypothetical protein